MNTAISRLRRIERDMKLAIVSCRCDPLTSIKFAMFLHSAKVYGHDIIWYQGTASGTVYSDFADAKVNRLMPVLEQLKQDGYTHVLYTDSTDAFFVATKGKIIDAYKKLGFPPVLFSRERGCYPHHHLVIPEHLQYPNTGQYIGEVDALITMWTAVKERYGDTPGDNEQGWMQKACADNVNVVLDLDSKIFRADASDYNVESWSACLLHSQGGYSHPERGKYDGMLPLFLKVFGEEPKWG